jgi:hypothetical protein
MSIEPVPENLRILCRSGRIWLTQSGDSRDFLLRAGESFNAAQHGRIVLWALAETRIEVAARAQEAALRWQPALKRA